MTEPTMPYLRAYYHEFTITGCPAVDGVLEAIALAGKAYHHTADWGDEEKYGPDGYWGLIQLRADAAADVFKSVSALPTDPPAEWIEAMARAIDPHGCNWKNQLPGSLKDFARQQARAAYAALARQMGGGDVAVELPQGA